MAEVTAPTAHHGIVFIGFMAAGKTRAAQAVAERLGLGGIDTDELLGRGLGEPISPFFSRGGGRGARPGGERPGRAARGGGGGADLLVLRAGGGGGVPPP